MKNKLINFLNMNVHVQKVIVISSKKETLLINNIFCNIIFYTRVVTAVIYCPSTESLFLFAFLPHSRKISRKFNQKYVITSVNTLRFHSVEEA